ncbi:MAG: hypothetical protein C7B45_02850 [Sulfobacillus acidophilus]|uniref:N-acetyltransferase domain-containing protein n=1 Tax=Sulfobacillus acidophilus TaxID=53633 RepID=A0A2T2WMQ2_9FIRM|nr:MAG: hypothetical protein C7B45_02850 [Sulfobacillus acidophilus]
MESGEWLVKLRPLNVAEDVNLALSWYADPEVLYFSEGANAGRFDAARVERMYRWLLHKGRVFIVEVFDEGWRAVGDVALCPELMPIVIGDPQYRNRGVGTQVLCLLIEEARRSGWTKLVAHKVYRYNTPPCGYLRSANLCRAVRGSRLTGSHLCAMKRFSSIQVTGTVVLYVLARAN